MAPAAGPGGDVVMQSRLFAVRTIRGARQPWLGVCGETKWPSSPEAIAIHLQMKEAFDSPFCMFHEALSICGRQEIRPILIGNYIRKLND